MATQGIITESTIAFELTSSGLNNISSRSPLDEVPHHNSTFDTQPSPSRHHPLTRHPPLRRPSHQIPGDDDTSTVTILVSAWLVFTVICITMLITICFHQVRRRLRSRRRNIQRAAAATVRPDPVDEQTATVPSRRRVPRRIIATFPRYTYWASSAVGEIEEEATEVVQAGSSGLRRETVRTEGARSEDVRSNDSSNGSSTSVKTDSAGNNQPGSLRNISRRSARRQGQTNEQAPQQQQQQAEQAQRGQQQQQETPHFPVNHWRQNECSICLQHFENGYSVVRRLPCKHIFHSRCITVFLSVRSNICPVCRKSVLPPEMLDHHDSVEEMTDQSWRGHWFVKQVIDWYEESGVVYVWKGVKLGSKALWRGIVTVENRVLRRNIASNAVPAT
ncbi:Zinc finger, RING/FYVE/PHD-type [Ascosphaera apis ARSEF 7405]|uniref:Zinc finger, RING/FYVE/PHD-type n=1 Tax=Ascosphaera apis ARSEF 7405 TaxID=392613 RepID=A0A168DM18_9EURO|nr:Zinc finger, RING/FYVE/PHD-type [Ascosphaera apis ARSEF 7405]